MLAVQREVLKDKVGGGDEDGASSSALTPKTPSALTMSAIASVSRVRSKFTSIRNKYAGMSAEEVFSAQKLQSRFAKVAKSLQRMQTARNALASIPGGNSLQKRLTGAAKRVAASIKFAKLFQNSPFSTKELCGDALDLSKEKQSLVEEAADEMVRAIKKEKAVQSILDEKFWATYKKVGPAQKYVARDEYVKVHKLIQKVLLNSPPNTQMAIEDWERDCDKATAISEEQGDDADSRHFMGKDALLAGIFEIAELYTSDYEIASYTDFLNQLHARLAYRNDAMTYVWRKSRHVHSFDFEGEQAVSESPASKRHMEDARVVKERSRRGGDAGDGAMHS